MTNNSFAIYDIETPLIPKYGVLSEISDIYCISVQVLSNGVTQPTQQFSNHSGFTVDGTLADALTLINSCDYRAGHNLLGFDEIVCNHYGATFTNKLLDTLVISQLMYTSDELYSMDIGIPNFPKKLYGSYSLKAFGYRFQDESVMKIEFEDFSTLTQDMIDYCSRDVEVTTRLLQHLLNSPLFPSESVVNLEQQVASIMAQQTQHGFHFDIEAARTLSTKFLFEKHTIENTIRKVFKPMYLKEGQPKSTNNPIKNKTYIEEIDIHKRWTSCHPHKRTSKIKLQKNKKWKLPAKKYFKFFETPHRLTYTYKNGEYQNIKLTKFQATNKQTITWLKRMYDFSFNSYTAKGGVKASNTELSAFISKLSQLIESNIPLNYKRFDSLSLPQKKLELQTLQSLSRLKKLKKDISQLSGTDNSLIQQFNPASSSIHGRVNPIGATTHRMTHSSPNLAQIPSSGGFRELFNTPINYSLVGADLANIEIRVLAHYLAEHGNSQYAQTVLSKDMHWYHCKLAGFWTLDDREWPDDSNDHLRTPEMKSARAASKAFFFAFLYSAGDTVRGNTLWKPGCLSSYTSTEYSQAKKRVKQRIKLIDGKEYFPLKKDEYIEYNEELILKTIYGKHIADTFKKNLTGLPELIAACQKESKETGYVTAIDGRKLTSRSPHSALNLLLQGSAGIIGKQWMVNYHSLATPHGSNWYQQAYIHDEFQCAATVNYADILAKHLETGASMVTSQFNMNIPIKADAVIGRNWGDTH